MPTRHLDRRQYIDSSRDQRLQTVNSSGPKRTKVPTRAHPIACPYAMVGQYEPDQALCRRYAPFASSLERQQFVIIYVIYWAIKIIQKAPKDAYDDDKLQAELIGSTVEGGPIVRFLEPLASSCHRGEILGYGGERPIVAYRKGLVAFVPERASMAPSKQAWSDTTEECPSIRTPDLGSERLGDLISQCYKNV
ncbi:hypothetical protein HRG_005977 [Hirsutella rhossiliensis]|uniref:Uncharacterized protein n=1 Tax=Hirsutella rhossiliensis TaxID=111463 RepID=A0A9P8MY45_9HYPO|nr:uncharacterized protein HRG_05977 [Hirsutella rhossiliensis]KAH0963467.1 hypothetical protein HRG_05977 [Hirsutella rhossiliensis]